MQKKRQKETKIVFCKKAQTLNTNIKALADMFPNRLCNKKLRSNTLLKKLEAINLQKEQKLFHIFLKKQNMQK